MLLPLRVEGPEAYLLQAIPALLPAAKEKLAVQALIDFLRKESAASVMKAKGLEPVAP